MPPDSAQPTEERIPIILNRRSPLSLPLPKKECKARPLVSRFILHSLAGGSRGGMRAAHISLPGKHLGSAGPLRSILPGHYSSRTYAQPRPRAWQPLERGGLQARPLARPQMLKRCGVDPPPHSQAQLEAGRQRGQRASWSGRGGTPSKRRPLVSVRLGSWSLLEEPHGGEAGSQSLLEETL